MLRLSDGLLLEVATAEAAAHPDVAFEAVEIDLEDVPMDGNGIAAAMPPSARGAPAA